ncbi:hypothetical protein MKW98_031412 [Papaver atlanticum]|uniref:V-SNARE coiled-coil homology domain-containing protein n=1 Tax=Papaver atlanticum TaxID=357466 RepID=A0AAD4S5V8_9MAGN|nr:hypothetical protein MKW98_031412 [Papaver atlanticum]
MKITALLVLNCNEANPSSSSSSTSVEPNPIILVNACDLSKFGFFMRSGVREFIVFVGRTVAKGTLSGQRKSERIMCIGIMDDHYPVLSAFSLLHKVLDEYEKNFGDSWKTAQSDATQPWPYLTEAPTKFQDPAEADKFSDVQKELDETKFFLHETLDRLLAKGEKLDSLVGKSSDLSAANKTDQCCTIS